MNSWHWPDHIIRKRESQRLRGFDWNGPALTEINAALKLAETC